MHLEYLWKRARQVRVKAPAITGTDIFERYFVSAHTLELLVGCYRMWCPFSKCGWSRLGSSIAWGAGYLRATSRIIRPPWLGSRIAIMAMVICAIVGRD